MSKISNSPDRHSFQRGGYVHRQEAAGEEINQAYLDMFDRMLDDHKHKFDDPINRKDNLEYDLLTTDWILAKARGSNSYAQNLYAAMCNTSWRSKNLWPTLKEQNWECSWRSAGGIVADMQQKGDYIDWYCSGSGGLNREYDGEETNDEWQARTKYVPEGVVTAEIENDLDRLGWCLIQSQINDL